MWHTTVLNRISCQPLHCVSRWLGLWSSLFKNELSILSSFKAISWSSIKEISGETTRVTPFEITAGSWKHKLFPPPVGMIRIQSVPAIVALMHSSWRGRNLLILKMSSLAVSTLLDHGKLFADQFWLFSFFDFCTHEQGSHVSRRLHIWDCISSFRDWRNCCLSSKLSIWASISLSSESISSSSFDSSMTN